MSTFRQVIPSSQNVPTNERYEYLLLWLSVNGGVRTWFFSHTKGGQEDETSGYILEGLDDIRSIPNQDRTTVDIITESLTSDERDFIASIMKSNRVYQCSKAGVFTPIAIKFASISRDNQLKDFSVKLSFSYKENSTLDV